MKTKFLLFTVCALLIVPLNTEAQVVNILKKKKKTEEKKEAETTDEKIEKQVVKGVLSIKNRLLGNDKDTTAVKEGSAAEAGQGDAEKGGSGDKSSGDAGSENERVQKQERKRPGLGALSAIMGGGGADVPHKESYDFSMSINIEILSYEDGEANKATVIGYTTYINEKSSDVAIDIKPQSEGGDYQADMTMIYDRDNNTVFMLTRQGDQKMAIATPMDEIESMVGDEEGEDYTDEEDEVSYTKTGRTKNIHGYKCEEYTMVDEDGRAEVWVTHDADFITGREQMKEAGIPMYDEGPFEGGMVMEMDVFEEDLKTMSMYVRDINKNIRKSFSLDTYSIMNVGTGGKK